MQLALTPDGRWDFGTTDLVSAAGVAGFTAVGVNADRVDAASVDAYASAGVRCHELLALVVGDDEAATMASAEQLADRAHAVGAEWVLTVFTAKVPPQRIERYAKLFDGVGAGMAVEFTPLGAIPSIGDGMEVVRAASRGGRAGLMIDSWHFCFSDNTSSASRSASSTASPRDYRRHRGRHRREPAEFADGRRLVNSRERPYLYSNHRRSRLLVPPPARGGTRSLAVAMPRR